MVIARLSRVDAIRTTLKEVSQGLPTRHGLVNQDDLVACLHRLCGRLGCSESELPSQFDDMVLGTSCGRSTTPAQLIDALLDMQLEMTA